MWDGHYKTIDYSKFDFYDCNVADDIKGATTNFTDGTPDNDVIPYPADAEDPDEAILVSDFEIWIGDDALADLLIQDADGDPANEVAAISIGLFEFDETDETTEAYRDELKQALARFVFHNYQAELDIDPGYSHLPHAETCKRVTFPKPQVFPLNPSIKTFITGDNGPDLFLSPENWYVKTAYRVVRNPLGELGRLLQLMRQELSG